MHYYIDGYNLLFRLMPAHENLQLIREAYIYDLSYKATFLNLELTLVFDSHYHESEASRSHVDDLEIIYTDKGESADDFIIKAIRRSENPKQHTVVTSDNKLAWQARRHLTNTMSVEDFEAMLEKRFKNGKSKEKEPQGEKDIFEEPKKLKTKKPLEGSIEYYRQVFEEEYKELDKSPPEITINVSDTTPDYDAEEEEEEEEQTSFVSDEERWLNIFEERSKKVKDDDDDFF